MKRIVFLLMVIALLGGGCKRLGRSSSSAVDTLFADTGSEEEEPIDSAALFEELESYRVESEPIVQEPTASQSGYNYHMIVGCFGVPGNAEAYVAKLRDMGYNASILPGSNNLQMVSAGSFETYQESIAQIEKFRIEVNPDAWVYRRR